MIRHSAFLLDNEREFMSKTLCDNRSFFGYSLDILICVYRYYTHTHTHTHTHTYIYFTY